MNFIEPDRLYFLIVPFLMMPLLAILGAAKRKQRLTMVLGVNANSPEAVHLSRTRRFWRYFFLVLAVVFAIFAFARPYLDARLLPFEDAGRDILVLFDVSRSMNAADIAPSRLRHGRFLLRQLSEKSRNDRFGVIPFAGRAYLSCPLTSDPVTFQEYVDELSTDSVPAGGTNLEEAFKTAIRAFEGSQSSSRAIILLTDGEELQGDLTPLMAELAKKKIPVFAVGFGDPVNGAVIPVEPGKDALVRDQQGKIVTSKLNEKLLSSLASATKGIYFRTSVTDPGVKELQTAIDKLDRQKRENIKTKLPVEEFPKALFLSLLFLFLFLLLSERKSVKKALLFPALCLLPGSVNGSDVPPAPKTEIAPLTIPGEPYELYNTARKLQLENNREYETLYRKLISDHPGLPALRSAAFHNLAVGVHNTCLKEGSEARKLLQQSQLQPALEGVTKALKSADGAEELYTNSVSGTDRLPGELAGNLNLLARERKELEKLKKQIEDLLKQQQKAQQQAQNAQQQNRSNPQNQQQRQQQQRSIDQAQKESQKLKEQAQQMKQSQMADAADKASRELQKASEAKKNRQDKKSSEHIGNALRELGKNAPSQKDQKDQKKGDSKENSSETQKNPSQDQPQQGSPQGTPEEKEKELQRKGAEQMLELMGEDDKKLRSAIKKQMRMNTPRIEKDW